MKNLTLVLLLFCTLTSLGQVRPDERDPTLIGKWEFTKIELNQNSAKLSFKILLVTLFEDGGALVTLDTTEMLSAWFTENGKVTLVFEGGEGLSVSFSSVTDDIVIIMKGKAIWSFRRVKSKLRRERKHYNKKVNAAIEKDKARKLALANRVRSSEKEQSDDEEPEETTEVFELDTREKVFEVFDVSEKAKFTGGEDSLQRFIYDNLVYPPMAKENNIEGTVTVMFVVNQSGDIQDLEVMGARKGFGLEEEAIRLLKKSSGQWNPAKQRDKPVSMRFRMPIKFELDQ